MALYTNTSPWFNTTIQDNYLGIFNIRPVSSEPDDFAYTIESQYEYRPDLLAFDLYGETSLWWVFMQRNLDVIQDPIFDFTAGTKIFIPKNSSLRTVLGI
jgi:hypothetical protein